MGVKLGFSGTGWIAKIHARMAQGLPGVDLAAVANHRPDSMQAFAAEFGIPRQYETVEAMLAGGGIDGLVVCTPNYLHAPQTLAALEAGVPVMVEKPMAMSAGEAETMLEAAGRSGAHLMVAHCWRFHDEVRWLREQVGAGRLGQIIRTKSCGVHTNFGPAGWFTQQKLAGGGAMADMGIHAVDTTRYLLGDPRPVSVLASIGTYYGDYDVDDTGVVIINWENGVTSYVESGWWQPHAEGPEAGSQVFGTAGFGGVFPTGLKIHNSERTETETEQPGFPTGPAAHSIEDLEPMYSAQLAYFVECVRDGRQPNPGGLEGWVNMRIVEAAYASAQTGQLVSL